LPPLSSSGVLPSTCPRRAELTIPSSMPWEESDDVPQPLSAASSVCAVKSAVKVGTTSTCRGCARPAWSLPQPLLVSPVRIQLGVVTVRSWSCHAFLVGWCASLPPARAFVGGPQGHVFALAAHVVCHAELVEVHRHRPTLRVAVWLPQVLPEFGVGVAFRCAPRTLVPASSAAVGCLRHVST
jgi:hypothetical protein